MTFDRGGLSAPRVELRCGLAQLQEIANLKNELSLLRDGCENRSRIGGLKKDILALECEDTRVREALAECYELVGESRILKYKGMDRSTAGWKWPIRVIKAGWSYGDRAEKNGKHLQVPRYFPPEFMSQIARAAEAARFRRRHPNSPEEDADDSQLIAGWISETRVAEDSSAVFANVHLFKTERVLRAQLMAASDDRRLDLFGISHDCVFDFKRSFVQGGTALVATSLRKLNGIDMTTGTYPATGGCFLSEGVMQ
jgi:hypothetical protein